MRRFLKFLEKIVMHARVEQEAKDAAFRIEMQARYDRDIEEVRQTHSRIEGKLRRRPVGNGHAH